MATENKQDWYDEKHWPAFFGFDEDLELLTKTGRARHSVVVNDYDGLTLRAQHLSISRQEKNRFRVAADYLYHAGNTTNHDQEFFAVEFEKTGGKIRLVSANVMGVAQDIKDEAIRIKIAQVSAQLFTQIARRQEWVNPVELFQAVDLNFKAGKSASLPGLLPNGDLKQGLKSKTLPTGTQKPTFPARFMHGITGAGPEHYSGKAIKGILTRTLTLPHDSDGSVNVLTTTYKQGKTPLHYEESAEISRHTTAGTETEPLYDLKVGPYKGQKRAGEIKSLALYLPNRADRGKALEEIDLKNPAAVSAALKNIRMLNRLARATPEALRVDMQRKPEDRRLFLPSDIRVLSRLDKVIDNIPPAPKKVGRMVVSVLGGNGTEKIISEYDKNIGGNSLKLDYYAPGAKRASSLIIDAGGLFHDKFDLTFYNVGKFLRHKWDKSHTPDSDVRALLFTHMHEDHMAQLPLLVKKGYVLPPLVMTPLLFFKFKRKMSELGIDAKTRHEVLASCHIVDNRADFDPRNLDKKRTPWIPGRESTAWIAGTKIKTTTEVLPSINIGEEETFPRLHIGDFDIRVGPMPHSDPGNMYDIITPAASHRHTGDYKLDDTIEVRQGAFRAWLRGHRPDSLTADSTGALRKPTERTPKEAEIRASIGGLMRENADNRFVFPTLGSNTARLTTLIAAMNDAGRRHLIIDGKALVDLVGDLNKIFKIRQWAQQKYGVEILLAHTKKAREVLAGKRPGEIAMAVTGSQDEPYSSLNRALRDMLPAGRFHVTANDIIVPLQGPIPVGSNEWRRQGAAYFAENYFGARVLLPEVVKLEIENMKLAGSGHSDPAQMAEMIIDSGLPVVLPVHGGPDHLAAHGRLAESTGAEHRILSAGEGVQIAAGRNVTPFRHEGSEFVGIRFNNSKDQFWDKRNFRSTVIPTKPQDATRPGLLVAAFEKAARKTAGLSNELLGTSLSALSRAFDRVAANGFLTKDIPFGIEKYGRDVFTAKRISLIAGLDNETTGRDRDDPITQCALMIKNLKGETVSKSKLEQIVPDYHIPDPEAEMVTQSRPGSHRTGLPPLLFAAEIESTLKEMKGMARAQYFDDHPDDDSKAVVKLPLIAHNMPFDDMRLRSTFDNGLYNRVRPHVSDGIIGVDTRAIARALHAVMPDRFHVRKKPDSEFLDFTLQGLCRANHLPYDENLAHKSAMYDTDCALKLFLKQYKVSSDIVGQMLINADGGTNQLLNDMRGMDLPFGGPRPVFSYVSPLALRPDLQIGSLIGVVGNGRYAVVANLNQSPAALLEKSDAEIIKVLKDRQDGQLELIDLQKQPIILPAAYFFNTPQGRLVARETVDRHAEVIGSHLNLVSQQSNWKNLAERLDDMWEGQGRAIACMRDAMASDDVPDLHRALPTSLPSGRTPLQDAVENRVRSVRAGAFNPVSQIIAQKIGAYRVAAVAYLRADSAGRAATLENLTALYKDVAKQMPDKHLLLHNIHYDIAKDDLAAKDRETVDRYRAWQAHKTVVRAQESLTRLEKVKDAGEFSLKERRLFNEHKNYAAEKAVEYQLDETGRLHIHGQREFIRNADENAAPKFNAA